MSPSEDDLRHALQHDEANGGIDVQSIMAAGERRRAQRRSRLGTGVAVGALVAVVASGSVLLANTRDSGTGGGSSADNAGGAGANRAAAGASSSGKVAAAPQASSAANQSRADTCPTSFPALALPGGGSRGQFGSGGKLFAERVATITVCAYGTSTGDVRRSDGVVVSGAAAQALVTSLEGATTSYPGCPMTVGKKRATYRFALLPVTAAGRTLATVTVALDSGGCPNLVSNSTAIRTLWQPPSRFAGIFATPDSTATTSPGRIKGSPVRS